MASSSKDARREAAHMIGRVLRDGAYANRLLNATFQKERWDPRDRGLLTELVYGVLQRLYSIDNAIDIVSRKGVSSIDPAILNHLRVATYQLLFLDNVAEHAVLSQAVKYVRKLRGDRVGGFVNALLRKIQRSPNKRFRFDDIVYLPDVSAIPDACWPMMDNLRCWIVDALRRDPHPTHSHLAQTLEWIDRVVPQTAVLTNMHNDLDYHTLVAETADHIQPAYDGLILHFPLSHSD